MSATERRGVGGKRKPVPPVGTVFYEVGFKRERPCAPVIITWVYCGTVQEGGRALHLMVEFGKWWNLRNLGQTPEGRHGLKVPDLDQLLQGRSDWPHLVQWVRSCAGDWRKAMMP